MLVFLALAFIKLLLLVGLRKHLNEIHWRIVAQPTTWLNYAAFCAFIGIGVLSLWGLGRYCRIVGVRAIRAANATVLGLGLLFIFLTFHEGDKNLLYPVMTGILGWKELGSYLTLNLFFGQPYLGAWLFGYALLYYVLFRSGREADTLYLTAVFAGAYGLACLREFVVFRNELLVADGFGLVSLLLARHSGRTLRLAWWLVPAAWALFIWGLFCLVTPDLRTLTPYFRMLVGWIAVLFAATGLLAKRRGFYRGWVSVLPFYFPAFLLLTSANYPMAANYNNLLCLAVGFPHYFVGELVVAGVLALGAAIYCRLRPGWSLGWLDVVNLGLVAVAIVDLRLSQIMGVRLEWDVLSFGNSPKMMWRMARPYLAGLVLALGIVIVVYILALRGLLWWLRRRAAAGENPSGGGGWYVAACFVLLGVIGLVAAAPDKAEGPAVLRLVQTSPWWKRAAARTLSRGEFLRSADALGLADFNAARGVRPAPARKDLNVLLVFMESSYNKYLSLFGGTEETQPLMSRFKERMEVFPNFFSNFAGSIHARFATFTSLYPIRDYNAFTLEHVNVKSLFEVLHDNGYTCSMFYSSFFDYTGFRDFLKQRGIDEMYDADTMPGPRATQAVSWGLREEETLNAMRGQIKKYASSDQRFFLTYVPAAPHYPYDNIPAAFRKFKMNDFGDYTPLYLNELLYMDWVLASIVDQLQASGLLDKTLVVITDDNGEMLGAQGSPIGHGWAITPELANVPLIIMDPQQPGYRVNLAIGSQIDLLPTVLDLVGIQAPADQLYEGRSLHALESGAGRLIYVNSYQQYGVIAGNHLICGNREADAGNQGNRARTGYAISNDGSKTLFTPENAATDRTVSIRQFDEFQESLLRNYSFYRESIRRKPAGKF